MGAVSDAVRPPEAATELVDCSVFAERAVRPGRSHLIQVFLHLVDQMLEVEAAARETDPSAGRRAVRTLEFPIRRGSRLTIHLTVPGCDVIEPVAAVHWQGHPTVVQFELLQVPATVQERLLVTASVALEDVPVGRISCWLDVDDVERASSQLVVVGDEARRYRKAFRVLRLS